MMSVAGNPADAVQLGMYNLFEGTPEIVVSGVNIGANFGTGYYSGSGTVGAALEAGIAGLPAFAFSAVSVGNFGEWAEYMRTPESIPDWQRFAAISAAIVDQVMDTGFPDGVNVVSVNMPAEATLDTPRRLAHMADTTYGPLFKEQTPGVYRHDWVADMRVVDRQWGSDVQAVTDGYVAVTPVRVADVAVESDKLRELFS